MLSRVQRVLFELADMPQTFFSLSLPLPSGLGSGLGSHMAAECPLPSDIYVEALESHLLSCLTHLHGRSNGGRLPPSLSLRSRNDLVQEARRLLDPASYHAYIQYTLGLSLMLPSYPGDTLPAPTPLKGVGYSSAEILAHDLLAWGQCSLWEAVRQVVGHLSFEKPRHRTMTDQHGAHSFTIGIFARPQLVGLCKATLQHANTSKLLCHFVAHLCPSFKWTTLAVHLNYSAPVHRDFANSDNQSLLALLSSSEQGGLWVEHSDGRDFQETPQGLRPGSFYQLQDQYIIFPANSAWHATQEWPLYDRYTLAAYTVRSWYKLAPSMQELLREMGYQLPEHEASAYAPPRLLPTVLLDPLA